MRGSAAARRALGRAGGLAAALAVAVGFPARAGILLRDADGIALRWDLDVEQPNVTGGTITYYVDPDGSSEDPPGETGDVDAVELGFASWEAVPGARPRFRHESGRSAAGRDATDRVNWIGWRPQVLGPFTLAATWVSSENGVILDADIVFNDTTKWVLWSTETPGVEAHGDVQAVATHEAGHLFGLDHSPVATATMAGLQSFGSVSSRSLEPDDEHGILAAYPNLAEPGRGAVSGTVRIGRKRARRGVAVVALDARTGGIAASTFTDDRGAFRFAAIRPGPYRIAACPMAVPAFYTSWWEAARADLVPGWHGEDRGDGIAAPALVEVRAGIQLTRKDVVLARSPAGGPGEPDDAPAGARALAVGEASGGAFEEVLDADLYRVVHDGRSAFDVHVRAWGVGSAADAEVAILAADGATVLAANIDRLSPVIEENARGPGGVDRDPSLAGFVPPGPGDLLLRVRAQPSSETGGPAAFYLVEVTLAAGVPDAARTEVVLGASSTRAPGGPPIPVTVIPRDAAGDPVGPGATVTVTRSDGLPDLVLADLGDGSYAGEAPAPPVPGTTVLGVRTEATRGVALTADAARFSTAGAADAARSTLTATPARIEADGAATAALVFVPRDAAGVALGEGLDVALLFDGAPAGSLGPVAPLGGGAYGATLAAPAAPGTARITATLGGAPTGTLLRVGLGWDLGSVAADLGADLGDARGLPGTSRAREAVLERAAAALDGIPEGLGAGDPAAAARAAGRAAARLRAAAHGAYPGGGAAAADLAEAVLRLARDLLDHVTFPGGEPRLEILLGRARALLARAERDAAEGRAATAARRAAEALRVAGPLL